MLEHILDADSVAIIGASKVETKRGYQAIKTLLAEKYEGEIYPVNPKEKRILGLRCYGSVLEIPGPVDLALITTPAATLPEVLEACGRKKIKGAVVIAGGFSEMGEAGRELEEEMAAVAEKHGIRMIGPNTSGMMNLHKRLNLVGLEGAPKGAIALLSQSGNMALALITEARVKSHKGFSYYVGVGNETDIKFHEYLRYFGNDPKTAAILMYVEGMREGRKFLQQSYKTTRHKPVILLKSGRSTTGKQSAGSHTGAMAGMTEVARSAYLRAGITVIENSDELFPVAEALSSLPPIRNNNVAILADGGGHATIAADLLSDHGVGIPELSQKTQERLRALLPSGATVRNPVDVAGGTDADPALFADCAEAILKDFNVGGLLIVGLFGGYGIRFAESLTMIEEDAAHRMGKMVRGGKKPILVHSLYSSTASHPLELLRYYHIPVHDSLDICCKCVYALADYGSYLKTYQSKTNFVFDWGARRKPKGAAIIERAYAEGREALFEYEGKELLRQHGVIGAHDHLARSPAEAAAIAKKMDRKVALKIVSPDILHKSDAGGVRLNLSEEGEIRQAYAHLMENALDFNPKARIRGVLVSPMAREGVEIIIGTKIDDQFGPVIMYGLGGILVEILKDVSFRVLPISAASARKMVRETKSAPILDGIRGNPPYDKKAIAKLLLTCSELIESYPEILEMDLNPVIVHENGLSVVDTRIILK